MLSMFLAALALEMPEAEDERMPFAPAEAFYAYTVDRAGEVIECSVRHSGRFYSTADLTCDDLKDADTLSAMLGRPLAGLSEVDLHVAFAPVAMTPASASQPPATHRRIIAAARLEIAPAGSITTCKVITSAKFAGLSLDLCDMMDTAGTAFEPGSTGGPIRKADVTFEALGFGG